MNRTDFSYWESQTDEKWRETMAMIHKGKDVDGAMKEAFGYLVSDPIRLANTDAGDFKRLVNGWLSNKRPERKDKNFKL